MSENGETGKRPTANVPPMSDQASSPTTQFSDPNEEVYYRALVARDPRFDGTFFVAVKSTGIYCRPVCPARKPRRDRCLFFPLAAMAEVRGYRPCLRCRPELAPGCSPLARPKNEAQRVLARVYQGALDHEGSVESLAQEFSVSS